MHDRCSHCQLQFTRGPGYYLGSTYINYGFVALTLTVAYVGLHFGAEIGNEILMPILVAYCVLMPILLFRHSRAWWLALDCFFDPTSFDPDNDEFLAASQLRNGSN
jgi:SNF family Na+-dependent transporter